ncbi:MAG TPA: hypothetical protein VNJ08_08750 [Bacteriovoracaceae bacterium]|nr:hypothetical protein [Bacteriovoracaceae bacterium]
MAVSGSDWFYMEVGARLGFLQSSKGVFGNHKGQLLYLEKGLSENSLYITFTLKDDSVQKAAENLGEEFRRGKGRKRFVDVSPFFVKVSVQLTPISEKGNVERILSTITWWTNELSKLQTFADPTEQLKLYSGVPGPNSVEYLKDLENRYASDKIIRPVRNREALKESSFEVVLIAVLGGLVTGYLHEKYRFNLSPIYFLFLAGISFSRFKKRTALNKKSSAYIIGIYFVISLIFLIFQAAGIAGLRGEFSVNLLTWAFKNNLFFMLIFGMIAFVSASTQAKSESIEVELGTLIIPDQMIVLHVLSQRRTFKARLVIASILVGFTSMFLFLFFLLQDSYITWNPIITLQITSTVLVFTLVLWLYKRIYRDSLTKRFEEQSKASFLISLGTTMFPCSFALGCLLTVIMLLMNHKLDNSPATKVIAIVDELNLKSENGCQQYTYSVPGLVDDMSLSTCEIKDLKANDKIVLIRREGYLGIPYLTSGEKRNSPKIEW